LYVLAVRYYPHIGSLSDLCKALGSPTGYRVSILLEELKEAYGLEYTWQFINIMKGTQKQPWYTSINPNGRIPAIVDHNRNDFVVFESDAILPYLSRHYDPDHHFMFPIESDDYSVVEQWINWVHGGVGPMQGQLTAFVGFAEEKIPFAIHRFIAQTERLYGVLDKRLSGERDFIAGPGKGRFSIADISMMGPVTFATYAGINLAQFPNVKAWYDRCYARPAVRRGLSIPIEVSVSTKNLEEDVLPSNPKVKKEQEEVMKLVNDAKEKYGYKYSSP
jgi:glutathione S-transferase